MGLVDYISRNPSQKAKKVSAYDEEFVVAKLKLICKSINALELNITHSASHIHHLLTNNNLALQKTPKIEAHNLVLQITSKVEASTKSINSISSHVSRVSEHVFSNSLAPRKQASNVASELSNLKYAIHAAQNPIYTSLAQQNTNKSKQLIQIRNEVAFGSASPKLFNHEYRQLNHIPQIYLKVIFQK